MRGATVTSFNAIDVETANADRASICQIGIVQVRNGTLGKEWSTLVDPEDWFDPWNVSIHGIDRKAVKGAPTLPDLHAEMTRWLGDAVVVSHTSFDRVALERAVAKYSLPQLEAVWLDSARVARRAWPDKFGSRGYGLKKLAEHFGVEFEHHDALEDAKAAAQILLKAIEASKLSIKDWLRRVELPIRPRSKKSSATRRATVARTGSEDGPLRGETVVFTGALNMVRREAANLAAQAGCDVADSVGLQTTILVVGTQNAQSLKGYAKSSKHRKAEQLVGKGAGIQILSENDFLHLVGGNISGNRSGGGHG